MRSGPANRIAARISESEEPLFNIRLISAEGRPVTCSNKYQLPVEGSLSDIGPEDLVYLSAFSIATRAELSEAVNQWQGIVPWVQAHGPKQSLIATSCSGSFLLAEAGLLNGKAATTAWWLLNYFEEAYPEVDLDREAICTRANNIICGAGN